MSAMSSGALRNMRRPAESKGRHAAQRPTGPLAKVADSVPTVQELLLWEQNRRYRALDSLESHWHSWGRGAAITTFIVGACGVGVAIGNALPLIGA